MNNSKNYKLDLATVSTKTITSIEQAKNIFISKKDCRVTDLNIMAIVPTDQLFDQSFIDQIPDEGFLISPDSYKLLNKLTHLSMTENKKGIIGNSKQGDLIIPIKTEGIEFFSGFESQIPTEESFTTEFKKILEAILLDENENVYTFLNTTINPKLLFNLSKAIGLGDYGLIMTNYSNDKTIVRSQNKDNKAVGLIMRIKNE